MFNSKWQMNRIGLIDFWYYDEEEFTLLDGRMLLRGSNGSGKSVTMQSFIPLLLDGNMRPERLDPFGSRARKMENYLLEEGDTREERTGYLYMEFKRLEGDNYLTIGIGLRARKNKKLDTWYFCITDGRRIGRDIHLYKDQQTKIAYTRQELKNRIGEGGQVLESQSEYMELVNRLLFGFETTDQYKEMLELLIQLRTPKLSKDFKPTVINDILGSSLQTLSEDDLRPMSEAIENMDSLKTNLDALKDSIQAAKQIERVYNSYNQILLYNKAEDYLREMSELEACQKAAGEYAGRLSMLEAELLGEKERYESLKQEETVLAAEKNTLDASDAAKLKEQEAVLLGEIKDGQDQVRKKERKQEEKKAQRLEAEQSLLKLETEAQICWESILERLADMEESLTDVSFDEFQFMKEEMEASGKESYDFSPHIQLFDKYLKMVEDGVAVLNKEKLIKDRYDTQALQVDDIRKERDEREREAVQYKSQLDEIKSELTEAAYRWEKQNKELRLSPQTMQAISRLMEDFKEGSDYSEIKELVRTECHQKEDFLRKELSQVLGELERAAGLEREKSAELALWMEKKDPEPEQPEEVRKSRQLLKERNIPYKQFYKTIDFNRSLEPEKASRLEEALLSMGILDALIIPAQYRSRVLALDKGVCDRYIFSDVSTVQNNLMSLLEVDNPDQDILHYQSVSAVLKGIGYTEGGEDKSTWVDEEGNFRLGILEGTVSKEYEARYIGVRARENFRKRKIQELSGEYEVIKAERESWEQKAADLKERNKVLEAEYQAFPKGEDLRLAAGEYAGVMARLERVGAQLIKAQEKLGEMEVELSEIRRQAVEICGRVYLTARLELFLEAREALLDYKEHLTQLRILHASYLNGLSQAVGLKDRLEDMDTDLDEILYDLVRFKRELDLKGQAVNSIQEQLALTNYEEIRDRLDFLIKRLHEIPSEREASVSNQAALAANIENTRRDRAANEELGRKKACRQEYLKKSFEEEYRLGYVEVDTKDTENIEEPEKQARKTVSLLSGNFGSRKQTDLLGQVQEVYHQNRGALLEYSLTMDSLFAEEAVREEAPDMEGLPSRKRIDITAKYRGIQMKFQELLIKLCEDMEEQSRLLSEKDRELFEDILANTISKKIRSRIHASNRWVDNMNALMGSMQTSSGLKLSLKWKNKKAEQEGQLDTRALVALLQKDTELMRPEEMEELSRHFRSKIWEARKLSDENGSLVSFHVIMREVLDYRKWFEFQLEYQKTGEAKRELTDRAFFTFSGGEKAMAMYVPLFSAVTAKYAGAREDAPRIISLDEAFAGVDEMNIKDMFRLMVNFEFNFIINSQILWGDYETVPAIAVYQLIRPENAKYVSVISYVWNGRVRELASKTGE